MLTGFTGIDSIGDLRPRDKRPFGVMHLTWQDTLFHSVMIVFYREGCSHLLIVGTTSVCTSVEMGSPSIHSFPVPTHKIDPRYRSHLSTQSFDGQKFPFLPEPSPLTVQHCLVILRAINCLLLTSSDFPRSPQAFHQPFWCVHCTLS